MIDWTDPTCKVTTNFSVKDCIFLPSWNRLATEEDGLTDEVKDNLVNLCAKMEGVRSFLGDLPILVHVSFRPVSYNKQIGGAPNSSHCLGMAMDYEVQGYPGRQGCSSIRNKLVTKLEDFDLRMEQESGAGNWIHNDFKEPPPGGHRYFIP